MKIKHILSSLICIAILFLSQNIQANDDILIQGNFEEMRHTGNKMVEEVINPHVIKTKDGTFIHLTGLDYPDLNYHDPGKISVTALEILKDFLTDKEIKIYQTKSTDKGRKNRLGHSIAHIVRADNDTWVQGMLLSLGVARTRTSDHNPDMASQMMTLESAARRNKSGIWEIAEYTVLSPEQAVKHIGSYQIIEGHIKSSSMHKNRLYLNFGNNWREDFTVSISAFDLKKFTRQQIFPKDWNGKKIRVRGWIESYNGPYMKIDHPQRFEALFEQKEQSASSPSPASPEKQKEKDILSKGTALPGYNN